MFYRWNTRKYRDTYKRAARLRKQVVRLFLTRPSLISAFHKVRSCELKDRTDRSWWIIRENWRGREVWEFDVSRKARLKVREILQSITEIEQSHTQQRAIFSFCLSSRKNCLAVWRYCPYWKRAISRPSATRRFNSIPRSRPSIYVFMRAIFSYVTSAWQSITMARQTRRNW